jgi:tetratricopeptide (TPR) repeat protein
MRSETALRMTQFLSRLFTIMLLLGAFGLTQSQGPADAIALEQQGKFAESAQAWRQVIEKTPHDAGAYASLGVVLAKQAKYADAVMAYRKALAINPKLPGIQLNLGLAEFKQGHFRAAVPALKAALRESPGNGQANTLLGLSYYGDKQFAEAAETLKPIANGDPSNMELQQLTAQSCLWARDYPCALAGFQNILRQQPNSASAHILVGEALDGLGKTPEAIAEFQEAAKVSPREPNVHFGLGFLYWKSHDYDKAAQEFHAELTNDPNNAQALAYLGDTEMKLGNNEKAGALLKQAIHLRGDLRFAYIDMGVLLTEQKDYAGAVTALRKAIALDPKEADAHYRLAHALQAMGQSREAEQEFKKVQELHHESDTTLTPKMSPGPPPIP